MPVSSTANLSPIAAEIQRLQPYTIMDLGVGMGLYGCVARQVLEGVLGRAQPPSWAVTISGVEAFEGYRNPLWGAYDYVKIGDFSEPSYYQGLEGWDLILLNDSLEHVDELEGKVLLHTLVSNNKHVIVSVPLGVCPQDACFGNEFERHRTTFKGTRPFAQYDYKVLHQGECLVLSIKGLLR